MHSPSPPAQGHIPLCRSDLLQDVTIALGRSMKSVRHSHQEITFTVSHDARADGMERLDIEAHEFPGIRKKIILWEDALAWIWHSATPREPAFECQASFERLPPDGIAHILRASLTDFTAAREQWLQHPRPADGET